MKDLVNADFFLQHETQYTQRWDHVEEHDDCYTWECSCGAIEESKFHSWDECHRHTRDHWAEKLRELLGQAMSKSMDKRLAVQRAKPDIEALRELPQTWRTRELRVLNTVDKLTFVRDHDAHMANQRCADELEAAGLAELLADYERLLRERPAEEGK